MPTHQFFIASYAKDREWLEALLKSLRRFTPPKGFMAPVVSVPEEDADAMRTGIFQAFPDALITTRRPRRGVGLRDAFISAQIGMMTADVYCEADYVWLLGSDCLCTGPFEIEDFFWEGLPVMCVSEYSRLKECHPDALCWRPGTARALGFEPMLETMRRLPIVYHRSTFPAMRADIEKRHALFTPTFEDYVYRMDAIDRATSESNWLGAYAHKHQSELYWWHDVGCSSLLQSPLSRLPNPFVSFWSHGGFDRPIDLKFEIGGKPITGRMPRGVIAQVLGS